MKLTGHKTEAVDRHYAMLCEAHLTEGLKKLAMREESLREKLAQFLAKNITLHGKIWRRGRDSKTLKP
jgi:dsDNA-binding SOS-regulon protein